MKIFRFFLVFMFAVVVGSLAIPLTIYLLSTIKLYNPLVNLIVSDIKPGDCHCCLNSWVYDFIFMFLPAFLGFVFAFLCLKRWI